MESRPLSKSISPLPPSLRKYLCPSAMIVPILRRFMRARILATVVSSDSDVHPSSSGGFVGLGSVFSLLSGGSSLSLPDGALLNSKTFFSKGNDIQRLRLPYLSMILGDADPLFIRGTVTFVYHSPKIVPAVIAPRSRRGSTKMSPISTTESITPFSGIIAATMPVLYSM